MDIKQLDLNVLEGYNPTMEKDEPFIVPVVKSIDDFSTVEEENPVDNTGTESVEMPTVTNQVELDPDETEEEVKDTKEDEPEVSANKVIAGWLSQNELLSYKEDEFEDSEEFIKNKYNETIEAKAKEEVEAYKASLPEDFREALENLEAGVPWQELAHTEAKMAEYSSIKMEDLKEDVSLQKEVVKQHLMSVGYDEDEADTKIEKLEENLMLEEESFTSIKKLVKSETKYKEQLIAESKMQAEEFRKEQEVKLKQFEDSVKSIKEIVPGLKVTEKELKEILNLTTKIVGKDKNGRPINGLKKLEMEDPNFLAKVAYFAGVLKFNIEPLQIAATTAATKKVKETANSQPNEKSSSFSKADLKAVARALDRSRKQRMF